MCYVSLMWLGIILAAIGAFGVWLMVSAVIGFLRSLAPPPEDG